MCLQSQQSVSYEHLIISQAFMTEAQFPKNTAIYPQR